MQDIELNESQVNEFNSDQERFNSYLTVAIENKLTRESYLLYYNIFKIKELKEGFTQDTVNNFLGRHNHAIPRAFLKHYLHFKKRKDLEIIKKTSASKSKLIVTIPDEHITALQEYFYTHNKRNFLLFELARLGALRRGESVEFKLEDIQHLDKVKKISNYPIIVKLTHTKREKERLIVIPRGLYEDLKKYSQKNHIAVEDYLFKISKRTWWKYFYDACLKLGFYKIIKKKYKDEEGKVYTKEVITPLYHLHSIRHTTSSNWWEKGVDIVDIQTRLGHTDIGTTRKYITPNKKKQLKKWNDEYNV